MFGRTSKKKKAPPNRRPLHIKTGDEVIVLRGEGSESRNPRKVLGVLPKERKVLVEGVNVMKDHQQQKHSSRASALSQEKVIEKPFPIDVARVALVDPKTHKATRVRMKINNEGRKVRAATRSGEVI